LVVVYARGLMSMGMARANAPGRGAAGALALWMAL
jgi:hypothetical protein